MLLVLDWDETITNHDTLDLVVPADTEIKSDSPPFSYFTDAYMHDYDAFNRDHDEVNSLEQLLRYLDDVDYVEKRSLDRIVSHGLFKGIPEDTLQTRAGKVEFREGWEGAGQWLQTHAKTGHVTAYVLSVNWSKPFIQAALCRSMSRAEDLAQTEEPFDVTGIAGIVSNELDVDSHTRTCTGRVNGPYGQSPMRTGQHKADALRRLQKDNVGDSCVYVGDSLTDLPCMLQSDVGIIVGKAAKLLRRLRDIGLGDKILSAEAWATSRAGAPSNVLLHAADWRGVVKVLDAVGHWSHDANAPHG